MLSSSYTERTIASPLKFAIAVVFDIVSPSSSPGRPCFRCRRLLIFLKKGIPRVKIKLEARKTEAAQDLARRLTKESSWPECLRNVTARLSLESFRRTVSSHIKHSGLEHSGHQYKASSRQEHNEVCCKTAPGSSNFLRHQSIGHLK